MHSMRAGAPRSVAEVVWCVGRDVDRGPGLHGVPFAAEGELDLAFEDGEHLLEVVPVRRRAAAGRDVHVDQAVATSGVVAREQDRVGVSDEPDVGQALVGVGPRDRQAPFGIVGRDRRDGF